MPKVRDVSIGTREVTDSKGRKYQIINIHDLDTQHEKLLAIGEAMAARETARHKLLGLDPTTALALLDDRVQGWLAACTKRWVKRNMQINGRMPHQGKQEMERRLCPNWMKKRMANLEVAMAAAA